jgi:hypothetical protein
MLLEFTAMVMLKILRGHATKALVEELLYKHDIKPPYINAD